MPLLEDFPVRRRDEVAMRIKLRITEFQGDAFKPFRYRVLEDFSLLMHAVPMHVDHLMKKKPRQGDAVAPSPGRSVGPGCRLRRRAILVAMELDFRLVVGSFFRRPGVITRGLTIAKPLIGDSAAQ